MTAKKLIEQLKQLPPDTEICTISSDIGGEKFHSSSNIEMLEVVKVKRIDLYGSCDYYRHATDKWDKQIIAIR